MAKYKTVNATDTTFVEFEKLAEAYELGNTALLTAMVNYFKVTKADPRDPKASNPTDAIKALDKRLIGFIREQERLILKPIKEAVSELASTEGAARKSDIRDVNDNVLAIIEFINKQNEHQD